MGNHRLFWKPTKNARCPHEKWMPGQSMLLRMAALDTSIPSVTLTLSYSESPERTLLKLWSVWSAQ